MAARKPTASGPNDDDVQALLDRHHCPVPFHEVRTRFLGNIASPIPSASPLDAVKDLWGGDLPVFDSADAANELIGGLVAGLWNRLTRHQDRNASFRLRRLEVSATRESLGRVALVRAQEVGGFIEGLFGKEESLDLPERAHRALNTLAEMRALLAGMKVLIEDPAKPATPADLAETLRNLRALTKAAESEIHEAVLACTRARRQALKQVPTVKPVLS